MSMRIRKRIICAFPSRVLGRRPSIPARPPPSRRTHRRGASSSAGGGGRVSPDRPGVDPWARALKAKTDDAGARRSADAPQKSAFHPGCDCYRWCAWLARLLPNPYIPPSSGIPGPAHFNHPSNLPRYERREVSGTCRTSTVDVGCAGTACAPRPSTRRHTPAATSPCACRVSRQVGARGGAPRSRGRPRRASQKLRDGGRATPIAPTHCFVRPHQLSRRLSAPCRDAAQR